MNFVNQIRPYLEHGQKPHHPLSQFFLVQRLSLSISLYGSLNDIFLEYSCIAS